MKLEVETPQGPDCSLIGHVAPSFLHVLFTRDVFVREHPEHFYCSKVQTGPL